MMMRRGSFWLAFAAATLAYVAMPLSAAPLAAATSPLAPDFTLKARDGSNLRLAEQQGSIVVLNFWASWCGPCRQEMPLLDTMASEYAELGVQVWGVNVEAENDEAKTFLQQVPVSFPIMFDTTNQLAKTYAVEAMPTTVIIDKNGKVRAIHRGYQPGYEKKYADDINALLAE
jgi:peroxiredoxin